MIDGGAGITPVYQVIQAVLRDQLEDDTEMHLVYANWTEDDMLLREEIDRWAAAHPAAGAAQGVVRGQQGGTAGGRMGVRRGESGVEDIDSVTAATRVRGHHDHHTHT